MGFTSDNGHWVQPAHVGSSQYLVLKRYIDQTYKSLEVVQILQNTYILTLKKSKRLLPSPFKKLHCNAELIRKHDPDRTLPQDEFTYKSSPFVKKIELIEDCFPSHILTKPKNFEFTQINHDLLMRKNIARLTRTLLY